MFQAWTDPRHLAWFFNERSAPGEPIDVDLRVGGVWKQKMVIDEQTEYFTGGVYREIVPVERLVFTWGAFDGWPKLTPEALDDGPLVTVTLNDIGERTEMVFHLALANHLSEEQVREALATGMHDGWGQTLDRLAAFFATVMTRP